MTVKFHYLAAVLLELGYRGDLRTDNERLALFLKLIHQRRSLVVVLHALHARLNEVGVILVHVVYHLAELGVVRRRHVGIRLGEHDNHLIAAHLERMLYRYGIRNAAVEIVLSAHLHRVAQHGHRAGCLDDSQQPLLVAGFGEELRLAGFAAGAGIFHVNAALEICIKVKRELLVGILKRHLIEVDYLVHLNELLQPEIRLGFWGVYLPRSTPDLPGHIAHCVSAARGNSNDIGVVYSVFHQAVEYSCRENSPHGSALKYQSCFHNIHHHKVSDSRPFSFMVVFYHFKINFL